MVLIAGEHRFIGRADNSETDPSRIKPFQEVVRFRAIPGWGATRRDYGPMKPEVPVIASEAQQTNHAWS
jgi:hypothetical protein